MKLPTGITTKMGRQLLLLDKASPKLLFAAGVVGFVGTVVLASRATLNLEERLWEPKKKLAEINVAAELKLDNYTEKDAQRDKTIVYSRAVQSVGKLYAPTILVGAITIACFTKSHAILTKRNAAITAAYAAMERAFSEYRGRVRESVGEEKERELYYPLEKCEIGEEDDIGEKKTELLATDNTRSMYARFFDKNSSSWNPQPEYNMIFLRAQQNWLNDRLRSKGHVFLNEAYDCLGIDRTSAGSVVGWVWYEDGDNYVDFGLFNRTMEPMQWDFFRGKEGAILLDFNVDGIIYDKIDKIQDSRYP